METNQTLIDTIRQAMADKGLNQKQAAQLLGISESRLSDLLNGKRGLNINVARALHQHLGIPADEILKP